MSVFSRIINGELPCYKVAENDRYLAFLDINPVAKGHTLVVPKQEVDYLFDLDDDTLAGLFRFAKQVARALDQAIECKRVGVVVVGTEVPHAHVHLIPFQRESQVAATAPKLSFTKEEMTEIASRVAALVTGD
jgi:histidine triad (HIT) family protein